ncbi:MAG: hypothetical protein DRR42_27830 [Gammaproteobacteria bacterium]|nr:MAG: hypothetical protein DRR42_27830 [Gammaproteobacteria bacterium]
MSINWIGSDVEAALTALPDNQLSAEVDGLYTIGRLFPDLTDASIQRAGAEILQFRRNRAVSIAALNRVFSGLFQETIHRCKHLGLVEIYFDVSDRVLASSVMSCFRLVARFSGQKELLSTLPPLPRRIEEVAAALITLMNEAYGYCETAIKLIRAQNDAGVVHPIFFYTDRQATGSLEDVVPVSSQRIGQFMVHFIDSYNLLLGMNLVMGEESICPLPPVELAVTAMECRAATRQQFRAEKVRVLSYEPTMNGNHVLTFPGNCLGLRNEVGRAILNPLQVFTNEFKIVAIKNINARKLQDLGNRELDVTYHHVYRRFAYERSRPLAALIDSVDDLRRLTNTSHRYQSDIHSLVQHARQRALASVR